MKVHTIYQSQIDGDLYVLESEKLSINILYGSITKTSSLLKYLPKNYDDFQNCLQPSFSVPEKKEDINGLKRQKVIENQISFKTDLMKPLNDYSFLGVCCEDHHVVT